MTKLNIHLSTKWGTGELQISFHPYEEDEYMPMDIADWPPVRSEIRDEVRNRLDDIERWESFLHGTRAGGRLDLLAGYVVVTEDGDWHIAEMNHTHPDTVPL